MSFKSIIGNLIATGIYAVLVYCIKKIFRSQSAGQNGQTGKIARKTVLKRQFFASLILLVVTLSVFFSVTTPRLLHPLSALKVLAGLIAGFSFVFTWGAFEAAFSFYPEDDVVSKPSEKKTDDYGKE